MKPDAPHGHPDRRDHQRGQPGRFGHAAVIGAGIAGLLAARALSETFSEVTIIERDRLPADPKPRGGVPQSRHAHALQARGAMIFEELFPGLRQELSDAGAPVIDCCAQARLRLPSGCPAPVASGILIQPCSRPLLESTVRGRVTRLPQIKISDGCTVSGLLTNATGRRVTGVRLTQRDPTTHARHETELAADLVVDTGGRTSHLADWLVDLGLPRPRETVVDARVGYASRTYHTNPETPTDWLALLNPPQAPDSPRGCFALHIENNQLIVTLQGAGGDHPTGGEDGFTAFADSLDNGLAEKLSPLIPVAGVDRYGRTANRRLHYHRVTPWPQGLIALGDSVCVFNPVYAQGMAVAAMEALALRDLLRHHHDSELRDFPRHFQRRLARITTWPWVLATLADIGWQPDRPSLPVRIARWYLTRWLQRLPHDQTMFVQFIRVTTMLANPPTLLRPRHLARIILTGHRHRPSRFATNHAARRTSSQKEV